MTCKMAVFTCLTVTLDGFGGLLQEFGTPFLAVSGLVVGLGGVASGVGWGSLEDLGGSHGVSDIFRSGADGGPQRLRVVRLLVQVVLLFIGVRVLLIERLLRVGF